MKTILTNWVLSAVIMATLFLSPDSSRVTIASPVRRVNVPYLGTTVAPPDLFTPAIFWFGKVDSANNYADVRAWYYQGYIEFVVHVIDRQLWYDESGTASQLTQWDALSLYFNLDGNSGSTPGKNTYRYEMQLYSDLQAAYQGNGSSWTPIANKMIAHTEWRGDQGPNSPTDSEGWIAYFQIPFSAFGLSSPPAFGSLWGLGVVLHDRDSRSTSDFRETVWPENLNTGSPSTWGQLSFGAASFQSSRALPTGTITVSNDLNGKTVVDAEVGGHTTCGDTGLDKWTRWGNLNYLGSPQINIQNQWDIADWPCFSKYYVTYPLDQMPPGKVLISATLTMQLFGGAGGGQYAAPTNSYIQVFTIKDDWNASTITWNNAPLAEENISGTWVTPISNSDWVPYSWDVGRAVAQAYGSGQPLRLALYSADGDYHSGKYFNSSTLDDVNGRPVLTIVYGNVCTAPGVVCRSTYLPITRH